MYYTPEEAAKILRVDRRTLYTWLREKKIEAIKFGGSTWRIPRSALGLENKPA